MIGVLEMTGANSVKFSARDALMPVARMPAATATALRIQAVLTSIAYLHGKLGDCGRSERNPRPRTSLQLGAGRSVDGSSHSVVKTYRPREPAGSSAVGVTN